MFHVTEQNLAYQSKLQLLDLGGVVKPVTLDEFVSYFTGSYTQRALINSQQADSALEQHKYLLSTRHSGYHVTQSVGHTFPDGEYFNASYYKFYSGSVLLGVSSLYLGMLNAGQVKTSKTGQSKYIAHKKPCCLIHLVQGALNCNFMTKENWALEEFRPIDPRTQLPYDSSRLFMLDVILASCAPMIKAGWQIALLKTDENRKIREPYFDLSTCFNLKRSPFSSHCERFYCSTTRIYILRNPGKCKPLKLLLTEGIKNSQ